MSKMLRNQLRRATVGEDEQDATTPDTKGVLIMGDDGQPKATGFIGADGRVYPVLRGGGEGVIAPDGTATATVADPNPPPGIILKVGKDEDQ